jgi:tetratricopeptide (TPR) repeat protein
MSAPSSASGFPVSVPQIAAGKRHGPVLAGAAVLVAGTVATYCRTLSVPFLFDDSGSIVGNPSIHRLWPVGAVLNPPDNAGVGGRPLLNLSFAINHALGGADPWGYHLFNLIVHVLASLTLFAVVRRSLQRPVLAPRFGAGATPLALATSAIWAWHPVQTEAVTYVSQRAESLMGLLYLLTLYCFIRASGTEAKGPTRAWLALCVLCCAAGAATKEVMATAPLAVLLYDRTLVSGSFAGAWRRHWPLYLALAASLFPLGHRIWGLLMNPLTYGVGFGGGVAWWNYALTECRVVLGYIGLAFWPSPLVFDYGRTVPCDPAKAWPYAVALAVLVAATVAGLHRRPVAGFAAAWFFLVLAPSSSVIPVVGESMAESRMYLPLAGVVVLTLTTVYARAGKRCLFLFGVIAVGLAFCSFERNLTYLSEETLWRDTVAKRPANARAHGNLGRTLAHEPGRLDEAIAEYSQAMRLDPDAPELHVNLGNLLFTMPDRLDEAVVQYQEALRLEPDQALAHFNLACALARRPERRDEAVAQYREALRLTPDMIAAHYNLANILLGMPNRAEEAAGEYGAALRLKPDWADAHFGLALALRHLAGREVEARAQLMEVLRLQPANEKAQRLLDASGPGP